MKTIPILISESPNGLENTYLFSDKRAITIKLNEEWDKITFWERDVQLYGGFEFTDFSDDQSIYLLKYMYSPQNMKRCGLGELVLRLHKSATNNAAIFTREPEITHHDVNDGSQLTRDAIVFVRAMQKLNLICQWQSDYDALN